MKKTKPIALLLCLLAFQIAFATNQDFHSYIDQYKAIAIQEMHRTGVPASIKLAQGLLESNAGRSTLAVKANNHFGIKCGGSWKGKKIYRKDDDYKRGKLVKSCFRSYKNAYTSYIAHSDFLRKDNFRRYGFLFDLDRTAYKKWAKGLKKAGYATSKTYSSKLIKIIEQYHLYKYDHATPSSTSPRPRPKVLAKREFTIVNDAKMVFAKPNDTPISIAKRLNTSPKRIVDYNEQINSVTQILQPDTRVFIQKKRNNYRGRGRYHTVNETETMYDIAQQYGLKLSKLYSKNKMPNGSEPMPGESLNIRGKAKKRPRLRINHRSQPSKKVTTTTDKWNKPSEDKKDKPKEDKVPVIVTRPNQPKLPSTKVDTSTTKTQNKPTSNTNISSPVYHTVAKGETLWRISQKYGMTVEDLMKKNNLQSTTIQRGMTLLVN